jgi:hypothetical protein
VTSISPKTLGAVHEFLRTLVQDEASLKEARKRFRLLQRRHPDTSMELVWQGEIVGPLQDGDAHLLCQVISRTRAQLDARTFAVIERLLFEVWLAERRATADIEWYWWNASHTRAFKPVPAA